MSNTSPWDPPVISRVEIVPEYPSMIKITDLNGAVFHYLPTDQGVLEIGRPMLTYHKPYTIHLFVPLAMWSIPRVLKVVQDA